ncbi:unnamed protein product [Microthlaspi erraticum]|uniref:Uncharacterized protein n=1 Tax=Microthlaspi erraticum TaxID=1685480 RepID=A0A6D2K8A7_9BRAS|nr:unnamed protein product [Microthlaspi erraticum]CAA7049196.1 unnamed protein product [Microthlaspi erraticum]
MVVRSGGGVRDRSLSVPPLRLLTFSLLLSTSLPSLHDHSLPLFHFSLNLSQLSLSLLQVGARVLEEEGEASPLRSSRSRKEKGSWASWAFQIN